MQYQPSSDADIAAIHDESMTLTETPVIDRSPLFPAPTTTVVDPRWTFPQPTSFSSPPLTQPGDWRVSARSAPPGAILPEVELASSFRIGRYTPAERRLRVERYRQKRARRDFSARVKYDCRKRIADRRARVRGRFVTRAVELQLVASATDRQNQETTPADEYFSATLPASVNLNSASDEDNRHCDADGSQSNGVT